MPRLLSLVLALVGGAVLAASCYAERPAPPAFRYKCSADGDCNAEEDCIDSICQVRCTQADWQDICTHSDHLMCFNGVCSSGCVVDDAHCPDLQECVDLTVLGIEIDAGDGGFIGGGGGPTGVCGKLCDDSDPSSCPEGELCILGYCVATCVDSSTCTPPLTCEDGLCRGLGGTDTVFATSGADTTGASTGGSSDGSTTATTGGVQ